MRNACPMTQARKHIVDITTAGFYHCIERCVRRSWLCGWDRYLKKSFTHRKDWVEAQLKQLGEIFACGIYSYAIMSNHLHIVVAMLPGEAMRWSDADVARRWVALYPTGDAQRDENKIHAIQNNEVLVATYRKHLGDLSWLMKSIAEPIARRANAEDQVKGRFWEGRFKCQALLNDRAVLAAMAYVDLNPVRAKIANGIPDSKYTAAQLRFEEMSKRPSLAHTPIEPVFGIKSFNAPTITTAEYLELIDFTGRTVAPNKRGKIDATQPRVLQAMNLTSAHWTANVNGVGSGYWRLVGTVIEIKEKASAVGQKFFGIGFARQLEKN